MVWSQFLALRSVILTYHLLTIMITIITTPPTLAPIAIHFHSAGFAFPSDGEEVGFPGLNHATIPDIFAPIAASISLL